VQQILQTPAAQTATGLIILAGVALALHLVARPFILEIVKRFAARTRNDWDGIVFDAKVPHRLSLFIPLITLEIGMRWVQGMSPGFTEFLDRMITALMVFVFALTVDALITAGHRIYLRTAHAGARPIKSYVQLSKVIVYLIAGIFIIARLADQSPWFFVSGLGAMMAVLLLIFRDTLLSLVASIQLTNNDVIRVGDWIEMPQFGADGDVIDIALNAVTVENWDKTITIIPTHKFLENSFRNWRHMFEKGGRRIKRAININMSTIRFLTSDEIERLSRFGLLHDYMTRRVEEISQYNAAHGVTPATIVDGRRLTNIGTFRAYIVAYLRNHPGIRKDFSFLVRQLAPTAEGLPLEIYVFTNDTRWSAYEDIQSDIFDHVLAIIPEFGLSVYQRPAGRDIAALEPAVGLRMAALPEAQ